MKKLSAKEIKLAVATVIVAVLAAGVAYAFVSGKDKDDGYDPVERAPESEASKKPNIVLIWTDDQNLSEFNRRFMPKTMRLLGDEGTIFKNFVVTTPVCCPSRAATMTGNYAHNNGVYSNRNGWTKLIDEQSNIGSWMQRAGYTTAWFGKFLQGYKPAVKDASVAAPGFDKWLVSVRPKYFGYELFSNGKPKKIKGGKGPRAYYTDKLTRKATKLITEEAGAPRPLFMIVNHLAPHRGKGGKGRCSNTAAPAPRDFKKFQDLPLPRPPSFGRTSDTQTAFAEEAGLRRGDIAELTAKVRCRAESLLSADRSIASIVKAFERAGELENTVIAYTSDNGLLLGEHGLTGKSIPYEEGIHMPFALRVPARLLGGVKPVKKIDRLVSNLDIAPTFLDLANADPCIDDDECRTLDGRSLVPLLRGETAGWPRDRAVAIEGGNAGKACAYRGLRLRDEVFLEKVKEGEDGCVPVGEPELYDLRRDPYQVHNLASVDSGRGRATDLRERLEALTTCAGISGRDEQTGDRPFCE